MDDIVCRELCNEVKGKTRLSVTNTQYIRSQRKRVKSGHPINDSAFLNDDFDVGSNAASSNQNKPTSDVSKYSEDMDSSDAESDSESLSDSYYSVVPEDIHKDA